jgi:micrococcal nuclease
MIRRLFLLAAVAAVALWAEDFTGKVVAITDGDTIKVMHNGAAERIRLWGIDCPESKQAFGTLRRLSEVIHLCFLRMTR